MTVNDSGKNAGDIRLLRRYQRSLLLGGGVLLSLALLCGAALAIWSDIQDYIAEGRAVYIANKALITQEIEKKQAAMRRGIVYAELVWQSTGGRRSSADFAQGHLLMQTSPYVVSQLLLGTVTPQLPPRRFARLLAFSETLAYAVTAGAGDRGESFAGYFFDPSHTFISIASPPTERVLLNNIPSGDVRGLIDRLAPDIGNLDDPAWLALLRQSRRVFWQPPMPDPFTGETVLQVAAPAFEGKRPFAVFVSSISFDVLYKWMRRSTYSGNFMIIDQAGDLILSSWNQDAIDPALTGRVLDSDVWKEKLDSPDYVYRDGMYLISEPLAETGWVFAYAYSWRTILAARGAFIMAYGGGTLLLLGLLWTLIYFYLGKVLGPLLLRSQRVFDSEQLNRIIVATAPNGLCLISERSGKLLLQNEIMKVYDNTDSALSRRLLHLGRRTASADGVAMHELTVGTEDRETRHLLVNIVRTRYLGEDFLLCSFSDITQRKQLERSLREARAAAESANQAKSAFLATMSHEIRTPLNGILGNLELLAHTPLTELQQDRLQTVTYSARTLLDIINDVLDFSKIESGQMRLEEIDLDIVALVEQAISMFVPLADDKGLDLYYRVAPQLPHRHVGDPTRLRQIVINLLSNAIKFTARGKVSVELTAAPDSHDSHDSRADETALVLRVADTGMGIAADRRKELFRPFEQGDVSVARRYGGTGLGLALCRRLTDLMGGTIDVESEEGQGSVFIVRLSLPVAGGVAPAPSMALPGGAAGVLCASPQWRAQLLPQLQAWGVVPTLLAGAEEWLQSEPGRAGAPGPLLLFGSPRPWSVDGEAQAEAGNIRIIDAREDGPRLPVVQGRRILVSCYSVDGLQRALLLAQHPPTSLTPLQRAGGDEPLPVAVQATPARVLVVEDHPVNLSLIGDQLRLLGYETSLAGNVGDGLQLFSDGAFDIVLTDLCMQGMDGYLFARMLRDQGAGVPIVAITAHAAQDEHRRCRDAGIDGMLLKPMSLQEIDQTMRRHLAASRRSGLPMAAGVSVQGPVLSEKLARVLRESSEASLESMRAAYIDGCCETVREHLHAIKGAFAMQQQENVVAACKELERDCQSAMPENFPACLKKLEKLETLVRKALNRIEKTAGRDF